MSYIVLMGMRLIVMERSQVKPAWMHVEDTPMELAVLVQVHARDLQVVYVKMVAVWDNKVSIFKRLLLLHMRVLSSNTCSSNILLYP